MLRKKEFVALAIAVTLFASCAEEESFSSAAELDGKSEFYKFSLQSDQLSGDGSSEILSSLHAYAYSSNEAGNGALLKVFENLSIKAENNYAFTLQLPATGKKKLYFLANTSPLSTSLSNESNLREAVIISSGSSSADMFYSAEVSALEGGSDATIAVKLIRGVARIDVNAGDDVNMAINKITYFGGADRAYVLQKSDFSAPTASTTGVNYEYQFNPALEGGGKNSIKENVFYVYENGTTEASIIIDGIYNGAPVSITQKLPALKRNSKYTVKLVQMGQQIQGTVEIAPWDDGGEIPVNPVK